MKNLYKIPLLILFGLLPLLSACGQTQNKTTQKTSQPGNGYFSTLNQQMQKIDTVFNKESSNISADARRTYQQMRQLWASMQARHSQMMQNGGGMMRGRGMMGRAGMMGHGMMGNGGNSAGMRAHMMSYLGKMQQMMSQSGHPDMASMFGQMKNRFGNIQPGAGATGTIPDSTTASASGNNDLPVIDGKRLYLNTCAPCHGSNANGMAGAFPPLNGSPIVAGNKETVIKIVLDGLEGPLTVNGRNFNSMMPTFGNSYNDAQIAGILTYLRSLSKNNAGQVTAKDVQGVRKQISNHSGYWTAKELGIK